MINCFRLSSASALVVLFLSLQVYAGTPSFNYFSVDYINLEIDDLNDPQYVNSASNSTGFNGFQLELSREFSARWFSELRVSAIKGDDTIVTFSGVQIYSPGFTDPLPPGVTLYGSGSVPEGSVSNREVRSYDYLGVTMLASVGYQFYQSDNSSGFVNLGVAHIELQVETDIRSTFFDIDGNALPGISGYVSGDGIQRSENLSDSGALIGVGYRSNTNEKLELGGSVEVIQSDDTFVYGSADALYKLSDNLHLKVGARIEKDETQFSLGGRYYY